MNKYLLLFLSLILTGNLCVAKDFTDFAREKRLEVSNTSVKRNPFKASGVSKLEKKIGKGERKLVKQGKRNVPSALKNQKNRLPQAIGGSDVYGWVKESWYNPVGLYEFNGTGFSFVWEWEDPIKTPYAESFLTGGFLVNGRLQGMASDIYKGDYLGYGWREYDFETGALLYDEAWVVNEDPLYLKIAYDYEGQCFYSFGYYYPYNQNEKRVFMKTYLNNLKNPEVLAEEPASVFVGICYSQQDKCLYGVNNEGYFVKISTDGQFDNLFSISVDTYNPDFRNTLGIVQLADGEFLLTPCDFFGSGIVRLNASTQESVVLYYNDEGDQYSFLLGIAADPLSPEKPSVKSIDFEGGSTTGSITYSIPETLFDGSVISGSMTAYVSLNGEPYGTTAGYAVQAGEDLKIEYSNLTEGYNDFGLYLDFDGHQSKALNIKHWIGYDTPQAPANVQLSDNLVSWSAVTSGIHEGYVPSEITYEISINGDVIGLTQSLSFEIQLDEEAALQAYQASVTATFTDPSTGTKYASEPAYSNKITAGEAWTVPFTVIPTEEQVEMCSIIDGNEDGMVWGYEKYFEAFEALYSAPGVKNDDWLIFPPFRIENENEYYLFSFEILKYSYDWGEEYLEVCYGDAPTAEAMVNVVVPEFSPANEYPDFETVSTLIDFDSTGVKYIGFHWISEPDMSGMLLRNISLVSNNITTDSPGEVSDLKATPAQGGKLSAMVSFDMPAVTINGNTIQSDVVISAVIECEGAVEVSGRPGEHISVEVATSQGFNTIRLYTSIEGNNSIYQYVDVYTGEVLPEAPVINDLSVAPDMLSVHLEWSPVTSGVNGGYVNPENISYILYTLIYDDYGFDYLEPIENLGNVTEYTYYYTEPYMAQFPIGVGAVNSQGESDVNMGIVLLGPPYELPMEETFAGGGLDLKVWMYTSFGEKYEDQYWNVMSESYLYDFIDDINPDQYVLVSSNYADYASVMEVPRFSTLQKESASVTMNVYRGEYCGDITILASCEKCQDKLIEVAKINSIGESREFSEVTFDLPESLMGNEWVQLYINIDFNSNDDVFLMSYMSVGGTAISDVKGVSYSLASVYGNNGYIEVKNALGKDVSIFDLNGKVLYRDMQAADIQSYKVDKGIYVVTIDSKPFKVIVK